MLAGGKIRTDEEEERRRRTGENGKLIQCAQKIQHRAYVDLNLGASFPIASLELPAYIARRMARSSPGLLPRHVARFLHPAPVQDESQRLAEL